MNWQRAPLLTGMSIFTCRHRNASLCAESSRYKNVQELKESDFNSVCEKRQTVQCISLGIGRLKHLQNGKMRLNLAAFSHGPLFP